MNQKLLSAGYSDQLVTELGVEMADGLTLMRLVQYISNVLSLCAKCDIFYSWPFNC